MAEEASVPAPDPSSLVPVQKRIVEWKDGLPVLATVPVLEPNQIRQLYLIAAAQPYVVEDEKDPDFGKYDGMTIAEVMVRKQLLIAARTGDVEAVMDRLIGKSLSKSESVNVNLSGNYEEYLKKTAEKLRGVVEGEVVRDAAPSVFGDLL